MVTIHQSDIPVLKGLTPIQKNRLAPLVEVINSDVNTPIFVQGDPASYWYFLTTGKVIIRFKPYDGPPLHVAQIEPGSGFGWSALLNRSIYTSSAIAVENSEIYRIPGAELKSVWAKHPHTVMLLLQRLSDWNKTTCPNSQNDLIAVLQSCLNQVY